MIVLVDLVIILTVFTYGSNFILYLILKEKTNIQKVEKFAIFFGVNMTILLLNGLFLVVGKMISSNAAIFLEQGVI